MKLVACSSIVHAKSQQVHRFCLQKKQTAKKVETEARWGFVEQKKGVWHLMDVEVFKKLFTCFVEMSSKHTQAGASFKLIKLVRHGLVKALS